MARPRKNKNQDPEPVRLAVIYARVSSKEQEEGFSIDAQLQLLRSYCHDRGFEVAAEFIEADTAKKAGRAQFDALIKMIRKGGAGAIVVEKTDRIYRNLRDRVTVDELDVELHLVKEGTILSKTSKSHEKFVHDIKLIVAKNYCDNLSEETRKGMEEKARQGIWPSVAPLGYRNVSNGSRRIIEIDPAAPHIKSLFAAYASGNVSIKQAGKYAYAIGLRTKSGKRVHTSSLHLILQNPLYTGVVPWSGRVYPGTHVPIIDRRTFERCQNILAKRANNSSGSGRADFIYRGLFKCGRCGCSMTPELKKGKYIYYHCTGFKGCDKKSISEAEITRQFGEILQGLEIRPVVMEQLRQGLRESHKEQRLEHVERLEALGAHKKTLEIRLERLYEDKISGEVPASSYPKLKARWEGELQDVELLIAAAERANRATWEDNLAILEVVSNSHRTYIDARPELQRDMFKHLVSNATIADGKTEFELRSLFKKVFQANQSDRLSNQSVTQMENWLPVVDECRTLGA